MSTAASADWGRSFSRELKNKREDRHHAGARHRCQLGPGARLLDHGRPRAARRDGEPLEHARGQVGRADADHLLVRPDFLATPGPEARSGGDGVGQGDQRDAHGRDQERTHVRHLGPRKRRLGKASRERADGRDAVGVEIEDGRDDRRRHDRHQHGRKGAGEPRQQQQDGERAQTDEQRRHDGPVESQDEGLHFGTEAVGVGREAEELRQLPDDDHQSEPVHVPDLDLVGEQVGDESQPCQSEADLDERDDEGQHPSERDLPVQIAWNEERHESGEDHR
jgi:hypothetical protein